MKLLLALLFYPSLFILLVSNTVVTTTVPEVIKNYGVQTKTEHCESNQALPDPACSPGDVLTTDIKTICTVGYTKTVRNVPLSVRKSVFIEYDIPYASSSDYEVDHIISLELGGSNDISNLYPESYKIDYGARTKDKLENYLHREVCNGSITIQEAQKEISGDWVKYYNLLGKIPN